MSVNHHISEALLLDYATGSIGEGWGLLIATHLALCPSCRDQVRSAEAVGGSLLEAVAPVAMTEDALSRALLELDKPPPGVASPHVRSNSSQARPADVPVLPSPLRDYLGGDLESLSWRRLGLGAHHIPVETGDPATKARLLRIAAGSPVPAHSHNGLELTLVLTGSFADEIGCFRRGDVEEADETIEHQPIAGVGEDCVCLAVTDAPLRFKNLAARLVQPFIGI